MRIVFYISLFLILWHNLLYWIILVLLTHIHKSNSHHKIENKTLPFVSLIIAAHNEEKVIEKKVLNALALNYPSEKMEIIFASDNSTDKTNEIISAFAKKHSKIKLVNIEKRGGKVNAYNKAAEIAMGEIFAFSDANTSWEKDSLLRLVEYLSQNGVSCVCGHLVYTNADESTIAYSENIYWRIENELKEAESSFYSLTALNGGIYAMRKQDYIYISPLYSHDLCFPLLLAAKKKRTIFIKDALAFERSSTTPRDEYKRKVRMFGRIYSFIFNNPSLFFNPFKYDLRFFVIVFSHRTVRYFLPMAHILLLISSLILYPNNGIFKIAVLIQALFLLLALLSILTKHKFKLLVFPYYYLLFLMSMLIGFDRFLTKRINPFWESAETTREK